MNKLACRHCLAAQAQALYHGYDHKCPDCVVRNLANSPKHVRQAAYDHAAANVGPEAAREIRRRVSEEHARIQILKGARPHEA